MSCTSEPKNINSSIIDSATGEFSVSRNGQAITLKNGEIVQLNDEITTGEQTTLDISFNDGSKIRLAPSTTVNIKDFVFEEKENNFLLELLSGAARVVTGKIVQENPDGFKVQTPDATIGIRGTEFFASRYGETETFATFYIDETHTMSVTANGDEQILNKPLQITTLSTSADSSVEDKKLSIVETVSLADMENKIDSISSTLSGNIPTTKEEQGKWNVLEDYSGVGIITINDPSKNYDFKEEKPYFINVIGGKYTNYFQLKTPWSKGQDDIINIGTIAKAYIEDFSVSTGDGNDKINFFAKMVHNRSSQDQNTVEIMRANSKRNQAYVSISSGKGDDTVVISTKRGLELRGLIEIDTGEGNDIIKIENTSLNEIEVEDYKNVHITITNSQLNKLNLELTEINKLVSTENNKYEFFVISNQGKNDVHSSLTIGQNVKIKDLYINYFENRHISNELAYSINLTPSVDNVENIYLNMKNETMIKFENEKLNEQPYNILYDSPDPFVLILGKNSQIENTEAITHSPIFLAGGKINFSKNNNRLNIYTIETNNPDFVISNRKHRGDYDKLGLEFPRYPSRSERPVKLRKDIWSKPTENIANGYYEISSVSTGDSDDGHTTGLVLRASVAEISPEMQNMSTAELLEYFDYIVTEDDEYYIISPQKDD